MEAEEEVGPLHMAFSWPSLLAYQKYVVLPTKCQECDVDVGGNVSTKIGESHRHCFYSSFPQGRPRQV